MTPIAERLNIETETELYRMANEWFFKWHFIGADGPAEMDDFRGGKIKYSGLRYAGSPRLVYWSTIQFYLRKKVTELFAEVESAIRPYPPNLRATALGECQSIISGFAGAIRSKAMERDRILRGDGTNFPPHDESHYWEGANNEAIARRVDGLRATYCDAPEKPSFLKQSETFLRDYKESLALGGAGIGALVAAGKLLGFF